MNKNIKDINVFSSEQVLTSYEISHKIKEGYELLLKQESYYKELSLKLQNENETMKPKAISYDTFMSSENFHSMSEVAKMFTNIGRNRLFQLLRDENVLRFNNEPYQKYIDNGYFTIKQKVIKNGESKPVTHVTAKGIVMIEKLLRTKDIYIKGVL